MSAASVGLSVGAGAGSVPTHLLPLSYRTSSKPPPPTNPPTAFSPAVSLPLFSAGSLCQPRLCRFHPRVYGDTRSPQYVRFLGQTRPSKCQQTTVSPQSHFLTKVTNLSPFLLKCNPNEINIRGGCDMATCISLPKNMVFTWTQYLHGVAYYCNLDFSLHAIVCTERPPRAICWSRSIFPSQETGGRVSSLVANHLQSTDIIPDFV